MSEEISVGNVIAIYWEMPASVRRKYSKEATTLIWGAGSYQEKQDQARDLSAKLFDVRRHVCGVSSVQ